MYIVQAQNNNFNSEKYLLTTHIETKKAQWTYQEHIENTTLRNVPSITPKSSKLIRQFKNSKQKYSKCTHCTLEWKIFTSICVF